MTTPLFGLVLAGGASTRMQRDKATLAYHGATQLEWAFGLLSGVCASTFVSVRPDQRDEPVRARFPKIVDRLPGVGPLAGIVAALQEHPEAAWLVVACDLPFLTDATLRHLIDHRDPQCVATAYRSAHDGLPEPLCAIWEPAAREAALAQLASGKSCPRKFLISANTRLLELPDARALDNVNTTAEFDAAKEALRAPLTRAPRDLSHKGRGEDDASLAPSPLVGEGWGEGARRKTLRVQYFAVLREQAGRSDETIDTSAATPADLYEELRARHSFQLSPAQLKVAINAEFKDWRTPLKHGDAVVFIPPVAGG